METSHNRAKTLRNGNHVQKRYETWMVNPQMSNPWAQHSNNGILEKEKVAIKEMMKNTAL